MTEQIHIGKRIRFFRERRGLTQKQLGTAAGIIEATVRKYEIGQRNPKPDQIKLIADALGVTPTALAPIGIETDADVISLILAIDDKIGITFDGKKDSKGKIDPKTLTLHIDDLFVNDALARYGNAKNHLSKLQDMDVPKKDKAGHAELIAEYIAELEEKKSALMDSSQVIGKDRTGITVKIPPDLSKHLKRPTKD
jgi:transcriptional regulator with XRE-family HTH domain